MIDRIDLITLIGSYGKLCADIPGTTPEARITAMRAIEDWCDAAILAEREACAAIALDEDPDGSGPSISDRIRARATP